MSDLVPCRYNPNHKVKRSRLVIHEYKCPNRFEGKVLVCPLDPNEKINAADYDKHVREHTIKLLKSPENNKNKKNNENKREKDFEEEEKEENYDEDNNYESSNEESEELDFNEEEEIEDDNSKNGFKNTKFSSRIMNKDDDEEFYQDISHYPLLQKFEDNDYNPNKEDFKLDFSKQNLLKIKKAKV